MSENAHLKKTLGPIQLWGLGVGYVISGMYFGWNLGLPEGGTLGMALATLFIIALYSSFTLLYTELACALPKAGGIFDYVNRAFGKRAAFSAGMTQNIEFLFAPPAIALAISSYLSRYFPQTSPETLAVSIYLLFTVVNILGVQVAARFELVITVIAVAELLLFTGITLPHFSWTAFTHNPLPNGTSGILSALPFAMWFFLAIEGLANLAEETIKPEKNLIKGFRLSMITLVSLCVLTFVSAIGVGGWEAIVYPGGVVSSTTSDSPLPLALAQIVGKDSMLMHLLVGIGIFGLVASFHGILLAGGRATYEFAKLKNFPGALASIHPRFQTPYTALIFNMVVGILALYTGRTADIIVIACFGALGIYFWAALSFIKLRSSEPTLERPYVVSKAPLVATVALLFTLITFSSLFYYYPTQGSLYFGLLFLGYVLKFFTLRRERLAYR